MKQNKIGFGGGCHWCTEAVFQQVNGVSQVEQGWIASEPPNDDYSEAVIVHYSEKVSLEKLIQIHLATHSSASNHSMRSKYRSAIYYFDLTNKRVSTHYLKTNTSSATVTKILPFVSFRKNAEKYIDYYKRNPERAFCQRYIEPKLEKIKNLR